MVEVKALRQAQDDNNDLEDDKGTASGKGAACKSHRC
jgi:hypothetical protein